MDDFDSLCQAPTTACSNSAAFLKMNSLKSVLRSYKGVSLSGTNPTFGHGGSGIDDRIIEDKMAVAATHSFLSWSFAKRLSDRMSSVLAICLDFFVVTIEYQQVITNAIESSAAQIVFCRSWLRT